MMMMDWPGFRSRSKPRSVSQSVSVSIFSICLLVVANVVSIGASKPIDPKDSLYLTKDNDVIPLQSADFENVVENCDPGVVWVVEFYNTWCGHCRRFAPTWKEVARYYIDTKWQDVVRIAAIDCALAENLDTCRKYNIEAFPTIKMFPPKEFKGRMDKIVVLESRGVEEIRKNILDFLTAHPSPSWPALKPLQKIEDIWLERKISHTHIMLLFENAESILGRQVILDTRKVQEKILLRRMLEESVTKFGINIFPSLYRLNNDSTYTLLAEGKGEAEADRSMFLRVAMSQLSGGVGTAAPSGKKAPATDVTPAAGQGGHNKPVALKYNRTVASMQDLESALHYSLLQEVAICHTISGDKLDTLRDFVNILLKYFPGRPPVMKFLSGVVSVLAGLPSPPSISGEVWVDKLYSLQEEKTHSLPTVIGWEACAGSEPRYRGYPCGMWTLFHTLTVEALRQSRTPRGGGPPQAVLNAVTGYMQHFFGCHECSDNFLQMAAEVKDAVTSHTGAVLWLWGAHNRANARLHGDISEDPLHPKVQFPSPGLCPKCHQDKAAASSDHDNWDNREVLDFLVNYYGKDHLFVSEFLGHQKDRLLNFRSEKREGGIPASAGNEKTLDWWEGRQVEGDLDKLRQLSLRKVGGSSKVGADSVRARQSEQSVFSLWGVSQVDMSMCVVFYLASTVIILFLYHHFIIRRRMRPCRTVKQGYMTA